MAFVAHVALAAALYNAGGSERIVAGTMARELTERIHRGSALTAPPLGRRYFFGGWLGNGLPY